MIRWMLLACALVGCAIEEAEPICDKGETQACACATGESGAQVCAEDGFAWGECKCEDPPPPEQPETCELDADCTDPGRPICLNFECAPEEGITILDGGARCDVPRSRCAEEFFCDTRTQRCMVRD